MTHVTFIRTTTGTTGDDPSARWCLFVDDQLLVIRQGDQHILPDTTALMEVGLRPDTGLVLGAAGSVPYLAATIEALELPAPFEALPLRQAYTLLPEQDYGIAGYGAQIAFWDRTTRFCPVCGATTQRVATEWSKECVACHFHQYPRINPATIVLIWRPGQVLLGRQPTWPPNRYSLVAGFVEAGESLEACVRREVAEEVGVTVDQIRYLGSQPWPFPHQLMVGFLAHYAGGELAIQADELEHAAWFDLDALPALPPPMSIARRILDWYVASQREPDLPFPADPY